MQESTRAFLLLQPGQRIHPIMCSARKIRQTQTRLCNIRVSPACRIIAVTRLRWVSSRPPYLWASFFVARVVLHSHPPLSTWVKILNRFVDSFSLQELRVQDYQQNRKTAGSSAFGQSAFASTTQPTATTNLFGQSAQPQPTNSIFGSFNNAGANSATTGGAFGGLGQTPTQTTGGFSTFNQPSQQPAQQPAASGFGSYNQPQQPQNTGLFGASNAFASQNKPLGAFGGTSYS